MLMGQLKFTMNKTKIKSSRLNIHYLSGFELPLILRFLPLQFFNFALKKAKFL